MQAAPHELDDVNGTRGGSHHKGSVSPARGPPARPDCLVHPYGTARSLTFTKAAKGAIILQSQPCRSKLEHGFSQREPFEGQLAQGPEQRPYARPIIGAEPTAATGHEEQF